MSRPIDPFETAEVLATPEEIEDWFKHRTTVRFRHHPLEFADPAAARGVRFRQFGRSKLVRVMGILAVKYHGEHHRVRATKLVIVNKRTGKRIEVIRDLRLDSDSLPSIPL